jgi:hypothetical protein
MSSACGVWSSASLAFVLLGNWKPAEGVTVESFFPIRTNTDI